MGQGGRVTGNEDAWVIKVLVDEEWKKGREEPIKVLSSLHSLNTRLSNVGSEGR